MQKDAVNMCILYNDAQLTALDHHNSHISQTVLAQKPFAYCS
jgi:hypothetical protein